jgi:hypothetical protein
LNANTQAAFVAYEADATDIATGKNGFTGTFECDVAGGFI